MDVRPSQDEYGGHFGNYIRLVPEGNLIDILAAQESQTFSLISSLDESQGDHRYAEGKWSLKEVIGHIPDTERVMSYRLLRISRGDETPLPGFDQDLFIQNAPFGGWSFSQLAEEYRAVRQATLSLLRGLTEDAWNRRGTASNVGMTVRALANVIAGHELHHVGIIRDKYL
ncbi:DinB family protein [Cohnella candidum]|uniref:DinB family protein n=1 Tax=Cohnella candidum TaxID=2674991 RepID=A0A3G3JXY4_9BACL|nr:DinB family protein [Cohnella candidum]AYQ73105.1 DinB family protein [Cohnella candidum]